MATVCRCCLIEGSSMKNLFSVRIKPSNADEAEDLTLADAYVLCTNLQLSPDTRQVSEICFNCEEKLIASYKFRIECRKASTKLSLGVNDLKVDEVFWNAEFLYNVPSLSKGNFFGEDQNALNALKRRISESSDDNKTDFALDLEGFDDPEIIRKEESKKITKKQLPVFECDECKRTFSVHNTYRVHCEKVHNSDYKCEHCDERFAATHSIQTYLEHRKIHTFDPVFNCNVCNSIYKSKKTLFRHRCSDIRPEELKTLKSEETLSGVTPSKFICNICDTSFTCTEEYDAHQKKHDYDKRSSVLCSICGHKATRPWLLAQHLRTHTGEKPFGCDICGKHFSQRSSLHYHKQLHTGMKEKCELCPKAFPSKPFLIRHMRFHNNERLFKCEICDQSFLLRQSLQQHIKVHHRLIRYKCSHCEKEFTTKSDVKKHETIHTGKPWWCPKCNYKAPEKYTLKLHISKVHKLNIDDLNVKKREPEALLTLVSNDLEGFGGEIGAN